jgi:UPF0042 nucleotide-binding protein
MKFLIITGRSGSGKSSCLHLLEDLNYYAIDNLPVSLLTSLPRHLSDKENVAIGVDIRNLPKDAKVLENIIAQLNDQHVQLEIIYLDTDEKTLLERFSSTRRKHPLTSETVPLKEALKLELELLEPLTQRAQYRIDTSRLSVHDLQNQLREMVDSKNSDITILFQSFGFKYGNPRDSDYMFDVRCLPNPYWEPELRALDGRASEVINFFIEQSKVQDMVADITNFVESWLPAYRADNRNYMTISIGCTGGKHRSVFVAECLYEHFKHLGPKGPHIQLRHRELHGR